MNGFLNVFFGRERTRYPYGDEIGKKFYNAPDTVNDERLLPQKDVCVFCSSDFCMVTVSIVGFHFVSSMVNLCILVNAHFRSVDSDRCLWMLVSNVWLSSLAPNKVKLRQKNQRRDFPALSFGSI